MDIEKIEARAKATTPGRWVQSDEYGRPTTNAKGIEIPIKTHLIARAYAGSPENAEFIAHAREDVLALVAEVRRLRALEPEYEYQGNGAGYIRNKLTEAEAREWASKGYTIHRRVAGRNPGPWELDFQFDPSVGSLYG